MMFSLQEVYAQPEYKEKLSQSRRRDPEHNRKISEAIRRKWAEEGYKNKTLSGIHSYQTQYQEAAYVVPVLEERSQECMLSLQPYLYLLFAATHTHTHTAKPATLSARRAAGATAPPPARARLPA